MRSNVSIVVRTLFALGGHLSASPSLSLSRSSNRPSNMGNRFTRWLHSSATSSSHHVIHVRTGDRKGAGTDANVWMVLHRADGRASRTIRLNALLRNDHERGTVSVFHVDVEDEAPLLTDDNDDDAAKNGSFDINKIELWRDSFGLADDWFVDVIHVEARRTGKWHAFPVQRWIKAKQKYTFGEYDSWLPQKDPHQLQRRLELEEKCRSYEYVMHVPDGPAQIKKLPEDETFSDSYKWDIITQKTKLLLDSTLIKLKTDGQWESLEALKGIYRYGLPEPNCLAHWNEDVWFGLQRLQKCNPFLIQLCLQIPEKFGVTNEMVEPILEGMNLQEALDNKKLFYVDLEILENVQCKDNRILCTPIALFYLNKKQELLPIAIQLFQNKGPRNPVFLPTDPPFTWLLAKMYYNNADATHHQSLTHLGFTHLMMEGVVICTHRNLSPSHPLFRLMAPHFLFLLAINTRGIDKLVSPGGWVDKTMTVGRVGTFELLVKGYKKWRMDVQGLVPRELESRNVLDPEILPNYPYRDEALPLYHAIRRYVEKVVRHFYESEEDIRNDYELQAWRSELALDRNQSGVGILGIPGDDENGVTNMENVTDLVTAIISTCSLGHGAANFQQYDEYAYPPNYPGILMGEIPRDKHALTEKEIFAHVPNKQITLDTMIITKLLSNKGTNSLGDFEVQHAYDPFTQQAAHEFRIELKQLGEVARIRNAARRFPYPWLDAEIIPNSISI